MLIGSEAIAMVITQEARYYTCLTREQESRSLSRPVSRHATNSNDFPCGGQLKGDDWGWTNPKDCGNFDFGSPLTARAANVNYHTEHVLEAQMIDLLFNRLNEKKSGVPDPKPNANPGDIITFCEYVDVLWNVPPFVWPGQDTTSGVGKA